MKQIKIFSMVLALYLVAGCASEEIANNKVEQGQTKKLTTEFAIEDNNISEATTASTLAASRTAGQYTGSKLDFFWTAADKIWVTDDDGILKQSNDDDIQQRLTANGTSITAKAKFYLPGKYGNSSSYQVRYTGKNGVANKVTIAAEQTQVQAANASHIGESGDCGTATATSSDGRYKFTLDHKAAYLTLMPYTTQSLLAGATLKSVRVWCPDQALCGQFSFDDNGIDVSSRPAPSNTNRSIKLTVNNFTLPALPNQSSVAATMVLAPGTYSKLYIEYMLSIGTITGTITKEYTNVTFAPGKNKRVSGNLKAIVYHPEYYLWDAAIGQHAWKGNEAFQPKIVGQKDPTHSAQNNSDPRWYNETIPFPGQATRSAKNNPNINEVFWYVQRGDIHWGQTLWVLWDQLYVGGTWMKTLAQIATENPGKNLKEKAPDNTDYRTSTATSATGDIYTDFSSMPKGTPLNPRQYLFFPAFGIYGESGSLFTQAGVYSQFYSSSSTKPGSSPAAGVVSIGENAKYIQSTNGLSQAVPLFNTNDENKYWPIQ